MLTLCLGAAFLLAFMQATDNPAPPRAAPTASPRASPKDVPTPSDPKERLELAEKLNGLHGMDMPWHLKASFEVFDPDGNSKDKGTFEEWRLDEKQHKIVFRSPAIDLQEYLTDHGTFLGPGQDWPSEPLSYIQDSIIRPVLSRQNPEKFELKNYEHTFGTRKLACTALLNRGGHQTAQDAASFCFAPANAVVLYTCATNQESQRLFEHIMLIHGHYVANDVYWFLLGKPLLKIHIDTLDAPAQLDATVMTVPENAVPGRPRVFLSGDAIGARVLKKVDPKYPFLADQQHVQGSVFLSVTIGTDGQVRKAEVLGGPQLLQQAAVDAVLKSTYQPYLLNEQPVEVQAQIKVDFKVIPLKY